MNKAKFMEWYCLKRECTKSSSQTTWYNIRRTRKLQGLESDTIPKNAKWVNDKTFTPLKKLKTVARKNLSASIVGYLKAANASGDKLKKGIDFMNKYSKEQDQIYRSQKKSTKQETNWVPAKKIRGFVKELGSKIDARNLYSKTDWTPSEKKLAQHHLMLVIHSNVPPRLEFSQLVYTDKEDNSTNENWLYQKRKSWFVVINQGKTTKKKGPYLIKLSNPVSRVLNKFKKHMKVGRPLFTDRKGAKITRNNCGKQLTNLMKDRFGAKVGASLFRTIMLSDKYKNMPLLKDMQENSHAMMHSLETSLSKYVKK